MGKAATALGGDTFAFFTRNPRGGAAKAIDPEDAKAVLEAAGWLDSDGDGIREKDGVKLTIRWLTYPSRQELPLLADTLPHPGPFIDPTAELARAAIRFCGYECV